MINKFIDECIEKAYKHESNLNNDVLAINGMSSPKVRHLLNNLCSRDNTSYLEIGSWRGSTLISSIFKNKIKHAVAIDNFSQFVDPHPKTGEWLFLTDKKEFQKPIHPKVELYNNLELFKNDTKCNLNIFDCDCQDIDLHDALWDFAPFNVYFYDGEHSYKSQKLGISNYLKHLSKDAIIIVDDWNASDASQGTLDAIGEAGKIIKYKKELFTKMNCDRDSWWNGIGIIVCE